MNEDNLIRREWRAMQDRFLANTGISMTDKESEALWLSFGLGVMAWNRLLMAAGDDEAQRRALREAMAEVVLTMTAGEPVGRVM